jgi:hypothetical protein
MTDSIEGGTYGESVSREIADTLITEDIEDVSTPVSEEASEVMEASSEEATAKEVETQETEQPTEEDTAPTEDDSIYDVTIDGTVYTAEQLTEAIKDSNNKSEWQKSNTQKAQDVSQRESELIAELDRISGVMKDEEVVETMKDILGEDHEFFKESNVKFSENVDNQEQPTVSEKSDSRVDVLEAQLQEIQLKDQVSQEINSLIKAHPELKDDGDAISEVLDIAVDRDIPNLEDALILAQSKTSDQSAVMRAMKKLKEADDLKAIPEVDSKTKGDHSPTVTKSPDFDHAREVAFKDYQLFE